MQEMSRHVAMTGLKPLGQTHQSATGNRWHGADERSFRDAFKMKKAKERPKRRDCQLRRAAVLARTPRHHKRDDIGRAQVTKLQGKAICRIPAIQKWAQAIDIPLDRSGYQGTLHGQKAPVPVQNYACRAFEHRRLKGRS
jgi:hypothetical protein